MEKRYPAQQKEVRKHLFKFLYRALQIDTKSRDRLAVMPLITEEDKNEVREMVRCLSKQMNELGDEWVLENCTLLSTSWYRRYRSCFVCFSIYLYI